MVNRKKTPIGLAACLLSLGGNGGRLVRYDLVEQCGRRVLAYCVYG